MFSMSWKLRCLTETSAFRLKRMIDGPLVVCR